MPVHHKVPPPPPAFHQASLTIHQYPFILLGGERHGESKVSCPRTKHIDSARSWTQTSGTRVQYTDHKVTVCLPLLLVNGNVHHWQKIVWCSPKITLNKLHKISTTLNFKNLPNFCRSPKFCESSKEPCPASEASKFWHTKVSHFFF